MKVDKVRKVLLLVVEGFACEQEKQREKEKGLGTPQTSAFSRTSGRT
jgi:hypothetical protein